MDYNNLRKLFHDDKSLVYFDARIQYLSDPRLSSFYSSIKKAKENYTLREINEFQNKFNISSWVIWGNDDFVKYNCKLMRDCHYSVFGVTHKDFISLFHDCNVNLIDEHNLERCLTDSRIGFIVNSRDYAEAKNSLGDNDRILVTFSHIVGRNGEQYFDYFKPCKCETFVDAGCLDGETSISFIKWCNGSYDKIYAFEPNPNMISNCIQRLSPYDDKIQFYPFAVWESDAEQAFDNKRSKWDARISSNGNIIVCCRSLDSVIGQNKVTFMKFDVEGSELKALYGAAKIIKQYKPRMAVSVYHNATDLFEIVLFLKEIVSDYKFALRHYHSDCIETILYVYRN